MKVLVVLILVIFLVLVSLFLFDKNVPMWCVLEDIRPRNNIENMGDHVNHDKEVNKFYNGSPTRGYYINYLDKVKKNTLKFLKRKTFRGLIGKTVVFDFDDTLAWTCPFNRVVAQRKIHPKWGNVFHYPPLPPMISLLKEIKKLGYNVVIITARPPMSLGSTWSNLEEFGVGVDAVFTSVYFQQDPSFKAKMRKNMEGFTIGSLKKKSPTELLNEKGGYSPMNVKVIMTIGDMWHDVNGQENTVGLKLPDPIDMNSYFIYNGEVNLI